jgi:ATP-binding cassette subfamily C protein
VLRIVKIYWKENLVVLLFILGAGISTTIASVITANVLDALIQFDWVYFKVSVIQLIFSQASFLFFTYFQIKYINATIQKMANYLRFQVVERIAKMSPIDFKKNTIGSYTSWLTNDINQIEQVGFEKLYELIAAVINILLSIFTLLFIHWSIFLVVIVESIIIIQLPRFVGKKLNEATIAITNQNEQSTSKTTYLLTGYNTFYNFKNLSYFADKIKGEFLMLAKSKNKRAEIMARVAILGGIGNVTGQLSSFALGGYLAFIKIIPIGMIWTVSTLSSRIFNIVGNLSQFIATIKSTSPIIEKINQFIAMDSDRKENDVPVGKLVKGIKLSNLSYSYNKEKQIFENINYDFLINHKYAIVGESGSGKSTILNILNGTIVDYKGTITLNGLNLSSVDKSSILDCILYVEQNPYILKGSIRENITLGDDFTDNEIGEALQISGLAEFKDHLDYLLDESGSNISGGQKQRIALARGLIRKKEIILLDESTSALDKKTAFEIENFIVNIPNMTVIMVSHNLTDMIKDQLDGILNLSE